jgi:hypothetical protein
MVARIYVAEGSSSTAGTTGDLSGTDFAHDSYPELYAKARPGLAFQNVATGGSVTDDFIGRAAAVDICLAPRGINILSVQGMSNTMFAPGEELDAELAKYAAYLDARRAMGWWVLLVTQAARADVLFNLSALNVNAITRGWKGRHCDEICDFGADPVIGLKGSAAATIEHIYDGVHPSMLTQNLMLGIIAPILDARFASGSGVS